MLYWNIINIKRPIYLTFLAILLAELLTGESVMAVEYAGRLFRDPFSKNTEKSAPKTEDTPSSKLVLKGVFWSAGNPQALINGQVVKIGDKVRGAEVIDIKKEGVKMRTGDNEEIFLLFKRGASS